MKKILLVLGIIGGSILFMESCTKEDGILNDGESRDVFIGSWTATDECSKQTYGVDIEADEENSSQVLVMNFANLGKTATAVIAGNSIYIESQDVGSGYTVNGNGKLNGAIISWTNYTYETDAELIECSATYSNKVK